MNLHLSIGPLVSLIAGILILMVPRLLNYIVAIYLSSWVCSVCSARAIFTCKHSSARAGCGWPPKTSQHPAGAA